MRSPKNKYRVELNYGKPIEGIGSSDSFTCNNLDDNHSYIQLHREQAKKNNTTLDVVWFENKEVYPKFNWVKIK